VYDLVLKNGKLIDGTGARWFPGDLGIVNGRIKKIGTLEEESKRTLDISNHVVCPGFIDIHSHSDITCLIDPRSRSKVMLVVFDPLVIQDLATYEEPAQFPLGIKYVIVNGVVVVSEGRHTDATPGKLLKHS